MRVRSAAPSDVAAIARIWNGYISDTPVTFETEEKSAEQVAEILDRRRREGHAAYVAVDGAEPLGFATYTQFRGGVGYARTMEHTVLLDPAALGRGAGRMLMAAVEARARGGGAGSMFAAVSSGNPDAIAFHARLGYREVAVLRDVGWKWDRWWDLHLMQKRLAGPA